jgi:hypothetical protein
MENYSKNIFILKLYLVDFFQTFQIQRFRARKHQYKISNNRENLAHYEFVTIHSALAWRYSSFQYNKI